MNTFDLQIQSTASDGKHTPREIVQMARDGKLGVIALTDHDTIDGIQEALLAGSEFGVRVISGIEISVEEHGAHILGFGVDHNSPELRSYCEEAKKKRIQGAQKMLENLKNAGFVVEWSDVTQEARGGVVARPHISRAILNRTENKEKLGGISTVHDFIEKHLGNDSPYYVKRSHVSAKDAIRLIHGSGGVAAWSHPAIHFQGDYEGLEKFLEELISWDIDGIETFTPSHNEDDVEFVQGLAVKYNLLKTAGSDFHERAQEKKAAPTYKGVVELHSASFVGDYPTYGFSTEDILDKLDVIMAKNKTTVNRLD